jgi:hypothetical protein
MARRKSKAQQLYESKRCTDAVIARLQRAANGEGMGKGKPPRWPLEHELVRLDGHKWVGLTPAGRALLKYAAQGAA